MAYHLAEKLTLHKTARGTAKQQLARECTALVLKIWEHRHSLPDGTRPLESFEPIYRTLQELSTKERRSRYVRAAPSELRAPKEMKEVLSAALATDAAASTLIRYLLAEAVSAISPEDKRWAKLRAVVSSSEWDIEVVIRLIDNAQRLVDEKERLRAEAIEDLENMIARLRTFSSVARTLEDKFVQRLSTIRNSPAATA